MNLLILPQNQEFSKTSNFIEIAEGNNEFS